MSIFNHIKKIESNKTKIRIQVIGLQFNCSVLSKKSFFRPSRNHFEFYNWIICNIDFKIRIVHFSGIQAQIDLIVEYFITIVEASLLLRQPFLLVFEIVIRIFHIR
jgi:hypothetical protein